MNCEKYQELISCLIDGELSQQERAQLENHIALCPECKAMYEDFAALSGMLSGSMAQVPDSLHEKIMSGVKAAKKAKKPLIVRLRPYMATAACLVVIVGAVFALRGGVGYDMAANFTADSASAAAPGAAPNNSGKADCTMPADAPTESMEESSETYFSVEDILDRNGVMEEAESPKTQEPAQEPSESYGTTDSAMQDTDLPAIVIDSAALTTIMSDGSTETVVISDLDVLSEALAPIDFNEDVDFSTSAILEFACGNEIYTLELCYAGELLIVRHGGEYWLASATVEEFLSIE